MKLSNIERILAGISIATPITVFPFFQTESAPSTPAERLMGGRDAFIHNENITPYVGNFPDPFLINTLSSITGDLVYNYGQQRDNNFLERVGKYLPEMLLGATVTYFTLGESILPQIMTGVNDPKDIPAAIIGSLAGYTLSKLSKKSGVNEKILRK